MKMSNAEGKLIKAYFNMLENTHYSKITVTDIIRNAQVSRTTFYRYYVDIFDMHEKICDKLAMAIIEECAKAIIQSGIKEVVYLSDKYAETMSTRASKRMFEAAGVKLTKLTPTKENIVIDFDENKV